MDQLFTVEEVAARLKVSVKTVKRWIKAGDLVPRDLNGGRKQRRILRFSERDLETFINRSEPKSRNVRSTPRRVPKAKKQYV